MCIHSRERGEKRIMMNIIIIIKNGHHPPMSMLEHKVGGWLRVIAYLPIGGLDGRKSVCLDEGGTWWWKWHGTWVWGNSVGCLWSWCMILVGDGISCICIVWCKVGIDTSNQCPRWPIDLFVLPPLFFSSFSQILVPKVRKRLYSFWCNLSFWKQKKQKNNQH